ncbi:MAG: hypothetical protein CM15mP126_2180 [Gammaproteobacteria bacterium]|nr:MAG: hypothetical protein CM15mP126_2180 [Gammaproteobacteria bacterium]
MTELFILCGKNQVNSLFAASANNTLAISTIGINVMQAIDALKKNIIQNISLLLLDCLGSAAGIGLIISLKSSVE